LAFYRDAGLPKSPAFCIGPARTRLAPRVGRLCLAAAAALHACAAPAQPPLPAIPLHVGTHAIRAELADTPETLREGLMDRDRLADGDGMLFVLGDPDIYCFWMKNTRIPLSIAFMDAAGRIESIQDMQPQSLDPHCPVRPVVAALEMNQGWFGRAGVRAGDRVRGIPGQPGAPLEPD
jgi:uncharacterized membrane protein (UPF0127 family)